MCKKFTLLIFIILISGLAAVQAQDSYIIVHALNPEGVEIGSIEGMPGFSFSVEILDDGLYGESLIGYAPVDSQTHNEPIRIDPGTHTIKARFNGMTKEKVLTVAPGETQTLTFVFERTEFDLVSYINSVGPNINFACDLYSSGWSEMVRRFSIQGEDPGAVYNRSITLSFSEDNSSTSKHSFECSYSGGQFRASTSVSMSWTIPNPYPVPWAWWAVEADTWINDIRGFGTTMEVPPPNLPKSGTFDFWHIQRIFDGRLGTFKLIPSDITTTRWYGIIYNNGGTLWPLETWDNQYIIDLIPEQADIIAAEFDIIAPTIMLQKASSLGDPTSGSASSSSEWSGTISSLKMSSVPYDLLGTGIHCGGGGPQPPECSFSAENPVWQNEDDNMILPYDEVDLKFMFTNTASNSVTNVRVDFIDSDLVHFVKHSEAIGTIAPGATFYTTNTIRIAGTDNSEIMNNIIDFNGSGQLSLEGKMEVHVKADQCPEPCVFQNLVPVDESGTTQFIQYPRFIDTMDSCPTGDIGNYYLQGDHDFHHPFDPLVRKYAVEAAVWPNSIFPDKVSDVVWNIARYIDGLVDDKDPGYAYNDIIIAKAIENKILTPGGRNYGFICIAQAYLFGSFARTIGVPAREIDVAIGRSIFQAGQNVYGILYSQEAAIQVWCGGPGWQFYDTFLVLQRYRSSSKTMRLVDDTPVKDNFLGGYRHGCQNDYENQTGIDAILAPV